MRESQRRLLPLLGALGCLGASPPSGAEKAVAIIPSIAYVDGIIELAENEVLVLVREGICDDLPLCGLARAWRIVDDQVEPISDGIWHGVFTTALRTDEGVWLFGDVSCQSFSWGPFALIPVTASPILRYHEFPVDSLAILEKVSALKRGGVRVSIRELDAGGNLRGMRHVFDSPTSYGRTWAGQVESATVAYRASESIRDAWDHFRIAYAERGDQWILHQRVGGRWTAIAHFARFNCPTTDLRTSSATGTSSSADSW